MIIKMVISVHKIMVISKIVSVLDMRILPINKKYGIRDYRGGGRSSARETAMRVAAGAIAKKYLREQFGIEVRGFLSQIGEVKIAPRLSIKLIGIK